MIKDNSCLFFIESFFESFKPDILFLKITAAAITGPARQPLPTSSTPAISFKALKLRLYSLLLFSQLIAFLIVQIQIAYLQLLLRQH